MGFIDFIRQSRRIFYTFYKPKYTEFKQIAVISGIGMILVGIIGLIIWFIFQIIP
ncbi:MAG: protein translocase SEC61 complex subunit gamma [Candidatus Micrarchaeia archaeon]|jgi:protein translocase SEC61 complex gamma subunit